MHFQHLLRALGGSYFIIGSLLSCFTHSKNLVCVVVEGGIMRREFLERFQPNEPMFIECLSGGFFKGEKGK
jgi:hypothetical protein